MHRVFYLKKIKHKLFFVLILNLTLILGSTISLYLNHSITSVLSFEVGLWFQTDYLWLRRQAGYFFMLLVSKLKQTETMFRQL